MNLREIIRSVIREEQPPASKSAPATTSIDSELLQRLTLFADLKTLNEKQSSLDARESEISEDVMQLAALEIEVDAKRQRIAHQQAHLWNERFANSNAIDRAKNLLRDCCSPQLVEFEALMSNEHSRLCALEPTQSFGHGEKLLLAENPRVPRLIFSNGPAIGRRLTAVRAAISRSQELRMLQRTEEELRAELAGLYEALPSIENCLELVDKI